MKSEEQSIVDFLKVAERLKSTTRHNWTCSGRQESVAEHSWRSMLFFMLAQDLLGFEVDALKTMKMLLLHDLHELVDGDIPAFEKDEDLTKYKDADILKARMLTDDLPEPVRTEYFELMKEFEEGETMEAKVAEALEKIESQLQHLQSGPEYWSEEEAGDHMVNYPNHALEELGDERVNKIWGIIKAELMKINKEHGI